jgi:hypothetical protein
VKFILIVILYATNTTQVEPQIMHSAFNSRAECEYVKKELLKKEVPEGVGGGAICISEAELLDYKVS